MGYRKIDCRRKSQPIKQSYLSWPYVRTSTKERPSTLTLGSTKSGSSNSFTCVLLHRHFQLKGRQRLPSESPACAAVLQESYRNAHNENRWVCRFCGPKYMGLSDSLRHAPPTVNTAVSQPNGSFHIDIIGDGHRLSHCDFESTIQHLFFGHISWHPFLRDRVLYSIRSRPQ